MYRAIYIGAGLDILPVLLFPEIREFIFIDSLPFSIHGNDVYDLRSDRKWSVSREERFNNAFSRTEFLTRLNQVMFQNEFELFKQTEEYLEYHHTQSTRVVRYFYSCAFPEHITPSISQHLKGIDTLILAGHEPHRDILNFVNTPVNIIVNDKTIYTIDTYDDISTFQQLRDNLNLVGSCYKYYVSNMEIEQITDKFHIFQ